MVRRPFSQEFALFFIPFSSLQLKSRQIMTVSGSPEKPGIAP
jgi:hypothetical protein